jgi:sulfate transport system permease protein
VYDDEMNQRPNVLTTSRITDAIAPRRGRPRAPIKGVLFFGVGAALLASLMAVPAVSMFQHLSDAGLRTVWGGLTSPEAIFLLGLALILALTTTLINAVMGTTVAIMLTSHGFPPRRVVSWLVDLPLAVPGAATGLSLLVLYGPLEQATPLSQQAGAALLLPFSWILMAHVVTTVPHVVRAVEPVLRGADKSREEAAMTMGASEAQVFFGVIFPSIRAALVSGSAVAFARSLGEFGSTVMVSGYLALRIQTDPSFIFSGFGRGDMVAASSVAALLVALSMALFFGLKVMVRLRHIEGATSATRDIA